MTTSVAAKRWRLLFTANNGYTSLGIAEILFSKAGADIGPSKTWTCSTLDAGGLGGAKTVADFHDGQTSESIYFDTLPGWVQIDSATAFDFDNISIWSSNAPITSAPKDFKLQRWDDVSAWIDEWAYTNVSYTGKSQQQVFNDQNVGDHTAGTGGDAGGDGDPATGGGGIVPGPGAHRYWIISLLYWPTTTFYGLSQIELRETNGGPSVAVGGTATQLSGTSFQFGNFQQLFNGAPLTSAAQWSRSDLAKQVCMYDFGVGNEKTITEVAIWPNFGDPTRTVWMFSLGYSDDAGATTTPILYGINKTWVAATPVVFSMPVLSPMTARYWGIFEPVVSQPGANAITIAEWELHTSIGGSDVSITTAPMWGTVDDPGNEPKRLIDNNNATNWANGRLRDGQGVTIDLATPQTIVEYALTSGAGTGGTFFQEAPKAFTVGMGSDGIAFAVLGKFTQPAFTAYGQKQLFPFIASQVQSDMTIDYAYIPQFKSDMTIDYAILRTVASDMTIDYAFVPFASDMTIDYEYAPWHSDMTVDYASAFWSDMTVDYRYQAPFEADMTIDYSMQIGSSMTIDYRMLQDDGYAVTSDMSLDYAFYKQVSNVTNIIRMPPETPITETIGYSSSVITSDDGTEQRAALREFPRVALALNYLILNDADRRVFIEDIMMNIKAAILIPQWQYGARIVADVAAHDTSIPINAALTDIRPGDYVYYLTPQADVGNVGFCVGVSGNTVFLQSGVDFKLPRNSWLVPCRDMRLADGGGMSMRSIAGTVALTMSSLSRRSIVRPTATANLVPSYDGLPLLDLRPLANDDVGELVSAAVTVLDIAPDGTPRLYPTLACPVVAGERKFRPRRLQGLDFWREFIDKTQGQAKPFLMPSFREDLTPISFNGTTLIVNGLFAARFAKFAAYSRLQIVTNTGSAYHKIVTFEESGNTSILELDTPIVGTSIARISNLLQMRLSADTITIEHNADYSEVTLAVRTTNT